MLATLPLLKNTHFPSITRHTLDTLRATRFMQSTLKCA